MALADYVRLAARLLPPGGIWDLTRDLRSELAKIISAFSAEADRVDAMFVRSTVEMVPAQAHDVTETGGGLLREWEAVFALNRRALTPAQRRTQLAARVTEVGGGSRPAYLIAQAAAAGFTISLNECRSFRCKDNCRSTFNIVESTIGMGRKYNWVFFVHASSSLSSPDRATLETLIVAVTHSRSLPVFIYDL